ncbi:hypothetical protein FHE72_21685 [Rossellomorea vietnamensis]|uniref:Uncharacterized protein n=1 Tax=Rossellomorea vietnamensis TaxID=218284 RepID=A0A6I6UJX4_9BACI|nr:hypothetical protein [Rossellomorea vietnamensis]QHE63305.1 hypothetical protein FHE72_21685 [Rossellomorea vietnamensis]
MNHFLLLRIYFKGELRAQGMYTKSKIVLAMNLFFYVMFTLFSFNMGRDISDDYMTNPGSYESVIYTGAIMTMFTLILVYNALSIKELFGSYSTEEYHFLFMKGLGPFKQKLLLFGISTFRALIVGLIIGAPMFLAFITEGLFTVKSMAAILLFLTLMSAIGFAVNTFFPSIKVTSLFPTLIIIYVVCFMAITFISYELTVFYRVFSVIQELFHFIKGDDSLLVYTLVFICTSIISITSLNWSNTQKVGMGIPLSAKLLKKGILSRQPKPVILSLIYLQSFNKLLIVTITGINLCFLLIIHVQNQFLNSVPTVSMLSMYFLYLMFISEVNNKLKGNSYDYFNSLPIRYSLKLVTKYVYLAVIIFPVPFIGLSLLQSFQVIPLFVVNFTIIFLMLEFSMLYKEKIHQLAVLLTLSALLFGFFIVSSMITETIGMTFVLYFLFTIITLSLLHTLKAKTTIL